MDDLKDYRVSAWMENGLLIRVKSMFIEGKILASSVLVGAALTASLASASNLDVASKRAAMAHPKAVAQLSARMSQHPAMVNLRLVSTSFESQLASIASPDESNIDPELLALADVALAKISKRQLSR